MGNPLTQLVKKCDQFPTTVRFLHRGENQYRSVFLGIMVILVWILTILISYSFINTYLWQETIIVKRETKKLGVDQIIPVNLNQGMMFAIGVQELDLRYEKAFKFTLSRILKQQLSRNRTRMIRQKEGTVTIPLLPCTPYLWNELGLDSEQDQHQIKSMFCPQPFAEMNVSEIQGLRLEIQQCDQKLQSPSFDTYQQTLDNYFDNLSSIPTYQNLPCYHNYYKKELKQFTITLIYINTLINPDLKQNYVRKYVEKKEFIIEFTESSVLRTEARIQLSPYSVQTNFNKVFNSFNYQLQKLNGISNFDPINMISFIYDSQTKDDIVLEKMNNFVTIDIMGTGKLLEIKRSYPDLFALFKDIWAQGGSLFAIFALLIFSFNDFQLNLDIVRNLYYKKKKEPLQIQRSKVSYPRYLAYKITSFFRSRFQNFCQSQQFKEWDAVEKSFEIVIDYQHMASRQLILEKACIALLGQHKYFSLYLQEPHNLENQNEIFLLRQTIGQLRRSIMRDQNLIQKQNKLQQSNEQINNDEIHPNEQKNLESTSIAMMSSTRIRDKNSLPSIFKGKNPQSNGQKMEMIKQHQSNGHIINDKFHPSKQTNYENTARTNINEKNLDQIFDQTNPQPIEVKLDIEDEDQQSVDQNSINRLKKHLEELEKAAMTDKVAHAIFKEIDSKMKDLINNYQLQKKTT